VVDVRAARYLPEIPWVETDDDMIAEVAIEHFAWRGLSHVAFCCETDFNWARWRRDAFVRHAQRRNMQVSTLDLSGEMTGKSWSRQRPRIVEWLKRLPEPCGLMAAYDSLARRLLDLCNQIDREVPHSIAVLGVDDDPILCQLASPPLSSVIPDAEQAGYRAADLLEQMMSGQSVASEAILLAPLGVATRRSTDTVAVDDPDVERAARFILANACDGIQVADAVATTKLTRRALELRFKSALGKTPHDLITATRIARAEQLLRETSLSLEQIAQRCGFEYPEYLSRLFRKETGTTPGLYRASHRLRA
jgi:LacI family transcriptional regulator